MKDANYQRSHRYVLCRLAPVDCLHATELRAESLLR